MAFFVQHFEQLITYLDQPGVPRTSNHAERANRHYRACTRPRYGWKTRAGQQALLIVLQGFDSSYLYSLWDSLLSTPSEGFGTCPAPASAVSHLLHLERLPERTYNGPNAVAHEIGKLT